MSWYLNVINILLLISCNLSEGRPGMSESIEESKKREVYICEFTTYKNPIIINDTLKVRLTVAWLEKRWAYDSNPNNSIIINGYQLIVLTKEELDENFTFTWSIGIDPKRYFRSCGYNCMMTDFDSLPKVVETWKIQEGRAKYEGATHKIIGEFSLYKK